MNLEVRGRPMRRIITTFPFTVYGVAVLFAFIGWMFASEGSSYDDGGFGLWMFLLGMVLNVFGFPFYLTHEFLFSVNNGLGFAAMEALAGFLGLLFFVAGDLILWSYRSWKTRESASKSQGKCDSG